jgi:Subtilase family
MGSLRALRLCLALVVTALIGAGCAGGGGGDGGVSVVPPSPPVSPPSSSTYLNPALVIPPAPAGINAAEYSANYGVGATGAAAAWSRGFTGTGIRIGVIDDGIEDASEMGATAYQEIVGRVDMVNSRDIVPGRNQLSSSLSHGTELTSIIAGNNNGSMTVGVAYGATILAIRADDGANSFSYDDLAAAVNYARTQNVRIINFSLGGSSPPTTVFRNAIAAATAAGIIIVNSAGNDGPSAAEVNYPGLYINDASVSNGLIISAGGVNRDGTFNDRSNYAASVQNYYLTAPGWEIIVPDFGPAGAVPGFQRCGADAVPAVADNLCQIQGTSYASPHVAGALALLMQAFPGLTSQQLLQLTLNSTDDQAAPGVDAITGHGRLNLVKAFQPAGTVAAPISGIGGEIAPGQTIGVAGAAFGDTFADPQRWRSVGFDSFGRTFEVNLASSWLRPRSNSVLSGGEPLLWRYDGRATGFSTSYALADAAPPAAARMIGEAPHASFRSQAMIGPGRSIAFAHGLSALEDYTGAAPQGHMAFVGFEQSSALSQKLNDKSRLTLVSQSGSSTLGANLGFSSRRMSALRFDVVSGRMTGGATFGSISEDGAVLGAAWDQRWGGSPRADTRFVAAAGGIALAPSWDFTVQGEVGATRMARSGWLTLPGGMVTTAGAAALRWSVLPSVLSDQFRDLRGAMSFSISQPLRVESGQFSALLPTANEYGRQSLAFERRAISASPTGREIDASVNYSLWASEKFSGQVGAIYRNQPGHQRNAPAEKAVTMGLRYGF